MYTCIYCLCIFKCLKRFIFFILLYIYTHIEQFKQVWCSVRTNRLKMSHEFHLHKYISGDNMRSDEQSQALAPLVQTEPRRRTLLAHHDNGLHSIAIITSHQFLCSSNRLPSYSKRQIPISIYPSKKQSKHLHEC